MLTSRRQAARTRNPPPLYRGQPTRGHVHKLQKLLAGAALALCWQPLSQAQIGLAAAGKGQAVSQFRGVLVRVTCTQCHNHQALRQAMISQSVHDTTRLRQGGLAWLQRADNVLFPIFRIRSNSST